MKLVVLFAVPSVALAGSWATLGSKDMQLETNHVSQVDMDGCISNAEQFVNKPMKKAKAVQRAMDHCALDKKVDDKNFVCPHYKTLLSAAFRRESTTELFDAKSFCGVTELYVSQLKAAAKIPNLGKGSGFNFVPSKDCKPTVLASFGKEQTKIAAKKAPDFCSSVCEAVRLYAHEEIFTMEKNMDQELDAEQVCHIYDEFVEDTHVNVEAYMHVVHGTEEHPVPSPENRARALKSAQMKNEAGKNNLRDSAAQPVRSAAANEAPAKLLLLVSSLVALWTSSA